MALSERISSSPDPLVGMSSAAGTRRLKFGMSVMVLPGRNPVVLGWELATGPPIRRRLLPAFGLGVADSQSSRLVDRSQRAKWLTRRWRWCVAAGNRNG